MALTSKVAREGDWQCLNTSCTNHLQYPNNFVFASKVNCPKCGTGRTAQKAGDWCCPNAECINHRNTVYGSKNSCNKCGALKPGPGGARNSFGMNMAMMGQLAGMQGMQALPSGRPGARPGDWHCANPECKNHTNNSVFASKQSCPLCGMGKPAMPSLATPAPLALPSFQFGMGGDGKGGGKGARAGDWHCANPACKNHTENFVFANKMHCSLCNTPKPAAPPSMYDSGNPYANGAQAFSNGQQYSNGGVMSFPNDGDQFMSGKGGRPGDWQCPNPSCRNHSNFVYASKAACTICGTARPTPTLPQAVQYGIRERSRSPMRMM